MTYLYYYNGAGVGVADFNNDGLKDIYFVGNQVQDKLYLNLGELQFSDVSEKAQIDNKDGWTNGISCIDINSDGMMDFYLTQVGQYRSMIGQNLLYVNQGNDSDGTPTFKEESEKYGLDVIGFSTQSVFFDYDIDGDLDVFLLNHSVHPNRSYGSGSKRDEIDELAGDKLYENQGGVFIDVSEESGIHQGSIGYGLGVSISDLNRDGYPDLYIGNDFFENDYLYINQGDGTFKDILTENPERIGHTSHYSMGNSIADLNNDGFPDIVSLDMLPEDLQTYKTSGMEDPFPTYAYYLKNGYSPQYMQNTLHWNDGGKYFLEAAHHAGISATEWSWSVLAEDFDLDGKRDLYISNGIIGATNDMDFISFIAQERIQNQIEDGVDAMLDEFISRLPSKHTVNYAYRNNGDMTFTDVSNEWFDPMPSYGSGAVSADLDNDGDLDIVVNNTNEIPSIWINQAGRERSRIKFQFNGDSLNPNGIGAVVDLFIDGEQQHATNFPVRSYLSSHPPEILFGLDSLKQIDSAIVTWPDGKIEMIKNPEVNQTHVVKYDRAKAEYRSVKGNQDILFNAEWDFPFEHSEEVNYEFDREILRPYSKGHEGPAVIVTDFDGNGLDDLFITGAKRQASSLFIQGRDGTFKTQQNDLFEKDKMAEDTDAAFIDIDNDNDLDLVVVSGGNEFQNGPNIRPRLYVNNNGVLEKKDDAFSGIEIHAGVIKVADIDQDGWEDIIIGANTSASEFGLRSKNLILLNNTQGSFMLASSDWNLAFENSGLIEDILLTDFDGNEYPDLVAVGHFMPVTIFLNDGQGLRKSGAGLENTFGWWNCIRSEDFDKDGDIDLIVGNWGLNTRLMASEIEPIRVYRNDFDKNGKVDPILTYNFNGIETVLSSKSELVTQLPYLNKEFLSYNKYSEASLEDLFGQEALENSEISQVTMLSSMYFENDGMNNFAARFLPSKVQLSSVQCIEVDDFDGDGYSDVLLAGNSFEISTQLGRLDASHGVLLLNDKKGFFVEAPQTFNIEGAARDIEKIVIENIEYYLVGMNDAAPILLLKNNNGNE